MTRSEAQKSSVESELKAERRLLDNERELRLSQLDECEATIRTLQKDVNVAATSKIDLVEQLSVTTAELGKHKRFVQHTLMPLLHIVKRDTHQSKSDVARLAQFFSASVVEFTKWKQRLACVHANEKSKIVERERVLHDRNSELCTAVETYKASLVEATNLKNCLEKKIELTAETARNVLESARVALTSERLSWEKALEDTKERTKIDLERIRCESREEVEGMKATLKDQKECHDHKCEIMAADRQRKLIEIQDLSRELAESNANIASKQRDIVQLVNTIDSLRAQQTEQERNFHQELEVLSMRHQSQLDERIRLNEQLRRENEKKILSEREKATTESTITKKQIAELIRSIAAERSRMIIELTKMNSQLEDLRSLAIHRIDDSKQELNTFCDRVILVKLKSMKRKYDATLNGQNDEIQRLRTAAMSFDMRLAAGEKEAQDAKAMLFNTIREGERSLRRLSENHKLEAEAFKIERKDITAKLEQKSKECEYHLSVIVEKDMDVCQLKKNVSCLRFVKRI